MSLSNWTDASYTYIWHFLQNSILRTYKWKNFDSPPCVKIYSSNIKYVYSFYMSIRTPFLHFYYLKIIVLQYFV